MNFKIKYKSIKTYEKIYQFGGSTKEKKYYQTQSKGKYIFKVKIQPFLCPENTLF